MKVLFIIFLSLSFGSFYSQTCAVRLVDSLCGQLDENSGLIHLNGDFITLNDSGGEPKLYTIDTTSGCIDGFVVIANVINHDWEALTMDADYIYIGDFGNNSGTRTDLQIHKISISDFNTLDTVVPTTLYFNYANQTDFTSTPNDTRFDCEAFVAIGDSLVLFSKNWTVNNTSVYTLPKTAGTYTISPIDSLETSFKVTDATYNPNTQKLAFVGYTFTPYAMRLEDISMVSDIFSATSFSCELTPSTSFQVEGVSYVGDRLFVSSERFTYGSTNLVPSFNEITDLETSVAIDEVENKITILQDVEVLTLKADKQRINSLVLYNSQGQLIKSIDANTATVNLNISKLNKGLYVLVVALQSGKRTVRKVVI